MKKIYKFRHLFLFLVLFLIGYFLINHSSINDADNTVDFSMFIVILDLLLVFINERINIIESIVIKLLLLITIICQMTFLVLSFVISNDIFNVLFRCSTLFVLIEMAIYIVCSFYYKNISSDIFSLKVKANMMIKRINKNQDVLKNVNDSTRLIIEWINSRNSNITSKNAKEVITLLREIVIATHKSSIKLNEDSSVKSDEMIDSIYTLYKRIDNNKLQIKCMDLVIDILKMHSKFGNRNYLKDYISLYCHKLAEYEFSEKNNLLNHVAIINKYITFLQESLSSSNLEIDLFIDGLDMLCTETQKYDFNFEPEVSIQFVQSYVEFYIAYGERENSNKFDVEQLVQIISRIANHQNLNSLELFENHIIIKIINSEKDITKKCDLIYEIVRVYSIHDYNYDSIILQMVLYLNKLFTNASDNEKDIIIELQLALFTKLKKKMKGAFDAEQFFDYLLALDTKERRNFINRNRTNLLFEEDNFNYILRVIHEKLDEENIEPTFNLLNDIVECVIPNRINIDYRLMILIIDELFDLYIKKYGKNSDNLKKEIKNIIDCVEICFRKFDNTNFQEMLFILLFDLMANSDLEELCYSTIIEYSYRVIEDNNISVLKVISNRLGWLLLGELQKKDINEAKANRYVKQIVMFYSLTCDFIDECTAVFVGTIFAVNGTYLELLIDTSREKKQKAKVIYNNLITKLNNLSDNKKRILLKSIAIRQESFSGYYEGFSKELVHSAKNKLRNSINIKK